MEDSDGDEFMKKGVFETKVEEEQRLKREFQAAADDDASEKSEDSNELLTKAPVNQEREDVLAKLYEEKEDLPEDDKFLLDYIAMEGWKGSSKLHQHQKQIDKEDSDRDSEMDRYEAEYNFRHETNALITTHGRQVPEESLRRTDDKRKNAREAAAQKKADEKNRRKDELDRLKALKREEIADKIKKAEYLAGIRNVD